MFISLFGLVMLILLISVLTKSIYVGGNGGILLLVLLILILNDRISK